MSDDDEFNDFREKKNSSALNNRDVEDMRN